ncbi:MAG: hypothetical protein DMF76_09595 [Acidobacteria bacterium]|nr:MAG: hypothetical protein DMF76_09595 [Acidobacteriota bacterium]
MRMLLPAVPILLLVNVLSAQCQIDAPGDIRAVLLIEGTQSVQMRESIASRKGRSGVTASKQYFIFGGPKAAVRTRTVTPVFQFDADPAFDDPVYLFRVDMRSDRREIRVAKGYGGLAELSIPKDHIIPTRLEEIGDGQNSTKRYRMKPTMPLRPGEYCLSRNISVCFDFGVD